VGAQYRSCLRHQSHCEIPSCVSLNSSRSAHTAGLIRQLVMLQRGSLPGKPTKPTPKQPKAPAVKPSSVKPAPSKVQDVKQQQRQRPSSSPAVSSEVQPRRPPYTKAPQVPRRPIKPPTEEVITNNYAKPAVERSSRGNLRFDGEVRYAHSPSRTHTLAAPTLISCSYTTYIHAGYTLTHEAPSTPPPSPAAATVQA
jgi:hypothetical protein